MLPISVRKRHLGLLRVPALLGVSGLAVLTSLGAVGCSPQDFEEIAGGVGDANKPAAGSAIPFEAFDDDVGTRASSETRILIRTSAGYSAVFGHAAPAGVDFSRQWVIFYAAGTKPTGGYDASVLSITRVGNKLLAITQLVSPGNGCAVTQSLTAPHVLVKFAAQPGTALAFGKSDTTHDCETNPCAAILCPVGTRCQVTDVMCPPGALCPARAACVPDPTVVQCGGFAGLPCPAGQQCVDDPSDDCDPKNGGADCGGICVGDPNVVRCGGIAGIPCPGGGKCVDDPSDSCDPNNGGADCGGICQCIETVLCVVGAKFDSSPSVCACVPPPPPPDPCATVLCMAGTHCEAHDVQCIKAPCPPVAACVPDAPKVFCGGIAGIPCPGFGKCVDDPSDSCDPNKGGADCGGMCQCIQNVACIAGTKFDSSPKVCSCVPSPPTCGPVCDIFCQYGHVPDANGCPTCACNPPPPNPTPCPTDKCPRPAPASPNVKCSDGKTIGGPACVVDAMGVCNWTIIQCPAVPPV